MHFGPFASSVLGIDVPIEHVGNVLDMLCPCQLNKAVHFESIGCFEVELAGRLQKIVPGNFGVQIPQIGSKSTGPPRIIIRDSVGVGGQDLWWNFLRNAFQVSAFDRLHEVGVDEPFA